MAYAVSSLLRVRGRATNGNTNPSSLLLLGTRRNSLSVLQQQQQLRYDSGATKAATTTTTSAARRKSDTSNLSRRIAHSGSSPPSTATRSRNPFVELRFEDRQHNQQQQHRRASVAGICSSPKKYATTTTEQDNFGGGPRRGIFVDLNRSTTARRASIAAITSTRSISSTSSRSNTAAVGIGIADINNNNTGSSSVRILEGEDRREDDQDQEDRQEETSYQEQFIRMRKKKAMTDLIYLVLIMGMIGCYIDFVRHVHNDTLVLDYDEHESGGRSFMKDFRSYLRHHLAPGTWLRDACAWTHRAVTNQPLLMGIIGANTLVYLLANYSLRFNPIFRRHFMLHSNFSRLLSGRALHTLVLYGFAHTHRLHFLGNMLALYLWGSELATLMGKANFAALYLACIVLSPLVPMAYHVSKGMNLAMVGASGAVFGLIGADLARYVIRPHDGSLDTDRISAFLARSGPVLVPIVLAEYWLLTRFMKQSRIGHGAHAMGALLGAATLYGLRQLQPSERIPKQVSLVFPNGNTYEGVVVGFTMCGQGRLRDHLTGEIHEGMFLYDKIDGSGRYIADRPQRRVQYEGEFVNGRRHGRGVLSFLPSGYRYEGNFANGLQDGEGVEEFGGKNKGDLYRVQYTNGTCTSRIKVVDHHHHHHEGHHRPNVEVVMSAMESEISEVDDAEQPFVIATTEVTHAIEATTKPVNEDFHLETKVGEEEQQEDGFAALATATATATTAAAASAAARN